jgi:phage-related protein
MTPHGWMARRSPEWHRARGNPLRDKLWEMRMSGRDGIARAIYIAVSGRRIVILHALVKKTQKTPPQAIRLALTRAKELEP